MNVENEKDNADRMQDDIEIKIDSDLDSSIPDIIEDKVEDSNPDSDKYSSFFDSQQKLAERVMGRHNVLVGTASQRRKYGLNIPSLALQYVVQSNVLFMEQLLMLAGKPASHKSSLAFEVARWVIMQSGGGFGRVFDTERKYSPTLALNLIGDLSNTAAGSNSWGVYVCGTFDDWAASFSKIIKDYRDYFAIGRRLKKKEKRPPLLPGCLIIDSLTGSASVATIKSAEKDESGSAAQGMRLAGQINSWLQRQNFTYLPWYIIVIRHEKEGGIDGPTFMAGRREKQTPGGRAPDFMGGYDLRLSTIDRERTPKGGYNLVRIVCQKNAFGVDRQRCNVRFSWEWVQEDNRNPTQVPRWEWDLATAEFLADFDRADIKDICHVVRGGTKVHPLFNCKQLGLVEVTGQEIGLALRQNDSLLSALQDYLHIDRWPVFDPHMEVPEPLPTKETKNKDK